MGIMDDILKRIAADPNCFGWVGGVHPIMFYSGYECDTWWFRELHRYMWE